MQFSTPPLKLILLRFYLESIFPLSEWLKALRIANTLIQKDGGGKETKKENISKRPANS